MNVEQMRAEIIKAYGGGKQWTYKVSHMSDAQVTAIYFQMKKSGRINYRYIFSNEKIGED